MNFKTHRLSFIVAGLISSALFTGCLSAGDSANEATDPNGLRLKGASQDSLMKANDTAGVAKVSVCHIPPGNPANAHTIVVGAPAVQAHLAHGDSLGVCLPVPDANDSGSTDEESSDTVVDPGT